MKATKPEVSQKHKEKKWKEAIKFLNEIVKVRIEPSSIHGVGVFAMRNIKKGEKLYMRYIPNLFDLPYEKFNKLRPEVAQLLVERWPTIVKGSKFLYPDTQMGSYLNHSSRPNYNAKQDMAIRDLAKGDEILEDYKKVEGWEKIYPWLTLKSQKSKKVNRNRG